MTTEAETVSAAAANQGTAGPSRSWKRRGRNLFQRLQREHNPINPLDFRLPASRTARVRKTASLWYFLNDNSQDSKTDCLPLQLPSSQVLATHFTFRGLKLSRPLLQLHFRSKFGVSQLPFTLIHLSHPHQLGSLTWDCLDVILPCTIFFQPPEFGEGPSLTCPKLQ